MASWLQDVRRSVGSKRLLVVAVCVLALAVSLTTKKRRERRRLHQVVFVHTRGVETTKEARAVSHALEEGLRYFTSCPESGTLTGTENVPIHYRRFASPCEKGVLLFLTGWSESMIKYGDLFEELVTKGFTIVSLDHRSQGFSGRPMRKLAPSPFESLKTHVESFDDHVKDALLVYNELIAPTLGNKPLIIMGFSLGGLVAAKLATVVKSAKLILIAPCLLVRTGFPSLLVRMMTSTLRALGRGEDFVPGKPFGKDHQLLMPPISRVSSSSARVRFWERIRLENAEVCINSMSIAHLDELLRASFLVLHCNGLLAERILVLSAELDLFVENEPIFDFSQGATERGIPCRHVHIHGAKHELLQEREEIRSRVLDEITTFLTL